MSDIEFTLKDAQGTEHKYLCEEFTVDETAELHADIGPVLAGPVATIFGALVKMGESSKDANGKPVPIQAGDIGALLARIDWHGVADATQLLPRLLKQAAPGGKVGQLYGRILAKTQRFRHEPTDQGYIEVPGGLATPTERDLAYGRGNIGELYKAVLSVLVAHCGPFGRSGLPLWSELSGALQKLLSLQRIPSTATPPQSDDSPSDSAPQIN